MYLSRAENLISYWAAESKGAGVSSSGAQKMSMKELREKFGGKAVP